MVKKSGEWRHRATENVRYIIVPGRRAKTEGAEGRVVVGGRDAGKFDTCV